MLLALPPLVLVGLAAALDGVRLPGLDGSCSRDPCGLARCPSSRLACCSACSSTRTRATCVLLCVLVLLAVLGGLFQSIDTLPVPLAGLAPVLPSYRLADLGWTALAGRATNPVDVLVLAGTRSASALWLWPSAQAKRGIAGS